MTTGAPVTPHPATLAAPFAAFSSVSRHLESSYRALECLAADLAGTETQLDALLEALPGGVLLIDGEGRVQRANAAATDLLGPPVAGERWDDLRARACDGGQGDLRLRDGRRVSLA